MASITLRSIKGSPLTLTEVDANFTALNTELGEKVPTTSYTAADVLSKLLTVDGASSGLDADLVDGLSPATTNVGNSLVSRNSSGNFAAGTITATLIGNVTGNLTGNVTGNLTGNVTGNTSGSAGTLANIRTFTITGDGSWTTSFNGSANVTGAFTLANTGVAAGTYTKITVDAKGRATVGTSLSGTDVTNALGYIPWHSGNDGSGSGLDADLLDGYTSSMSATENTVAVRDAFGDLTTNVFKGTATSARYADLAEKYTTDKLYPVGTIMVVSQSEDSECAASDYIGQHAIGVISENPAFLMNSESSGQAVAIKGRVPVRVVGPIRKGESVCAATNGQAILGQVNAIAIALKTDLTHEEKLVECFIL